MTSKKNLREITRDIVSAHIFSSDDKLLMGKKDPSKGGVYVDCWHIPGGGIDDEEDKIEALKREVHEETGLDISNAEITLIDDTGRGATEKVLKDTQEKVWCNMIFNVYEVRIKQNSKDISLKPTDDLIMLNWFSINDLKNAKLTPPSTRLFKILGYI